MLIPGPDAYDSAKVGGKAAALSALVRAGFDVPPFFVITPDGLTESGMREAAREPLATAVANLGSGPFAVRSSSGEEDGAANSHAGQFLSVLDVPSAGIEDAALKVWRSGETETLRAYRASRGLDVFDGHPAIIVQRMVPARAAGVAFSADPVSGRRDRIVISAVAGLGDRLVAGEADGDDYELDHTSSALVKGPQDGVLKPADITALAELVRRVETARGCPQDIEWAFEGDRLFLLQARPITSALRPAVIDDPSVLIFDNSNIVESYPGIVSPLTYSFAQYVYARVYRIFVKLLGVDPQTISSNAAVFENMLSRIDGRVYYNLINWYRALALLPGFSINRAHMETMMGVDEPLPDTITRNIGPAPARGMDRVREYWRIGRTLLGLIREAIRLKRTIREFYKRLDTALSADATAINAMSLGELAREYRRIESGLLERWDAPLINDFLCMIAFGASRKLAERWLGEAGRDFHNHAMVGQGDIVSAEPAQRIARMAALISDDEILIERLAEGDLAAISSRPALRKEFDDYLAKFADRCTEELKLESLTLDEEPRPLLTAIAALARNKRPTTRADSESDKDVLLATLNPFKRAVLRPLISLAKARVRDRENLRFERTRVFGRARRIFVAIGRQLYAHGAISDPRDVFNLTIQEVVGAIEGFAVDMDLGSIAKARALELAVFRELPDPPARIQVIGALATRTQTRPASSPRKSSDDRRRIATGCCPGVVTAAARVIHNPREDVLQPGEILVARHTDPGWIALFSNASAIVVERGSLLSHSAIVARELGIPCVVGLKGALEWISSGERIEVDGKNGFVRKADD